MPVRRSHLLENITHQSASERIRKEWCVVRRLLLLHHHPSRYYPQYSVHNIRHDLHPIVTNLLHYYHPSLHVSSDSHRPPPLRRRVLRRRRLLYRLLLLPLRLRLHLLRCRRQSSRRHVRPQQYHRPSSFSLSFPLLFPPFSCLSFPLLFLSSSFCQFHAMNDSFVVTGIETNSIIIIVPFTATVTTTVTTHCNTPICIRFIFCWCCC
mmetsp:Transcript_9330/g.10646  ORF Transcript_9330/g.10646 Transcript_9330/m.10646 type:complete len:208 (-) Transcript_9330:117-740(-)